MERTILVVEDSPTQVEHLRLLLEGEGYRVDVAADGREGLERVQAAPPDLIISDVVMPGMDGWAFCRAVKSDERTRRIPFVLLTERKTPTDVIKGFQHGADNFITKPFEDEALAERVRRIFEHLGLRRRGDLDVEITLSAAGRQIVINADKQQIVELLFATLEELVRANGGLAESQRIVEEHARNLEAKVQERTRELRSLFDGVPLGLYRTTPAGQILDVNPALVQMLGYPDRESLLAVNASDLDVNPADRARWQASVERNAVERDFEVQLRRREGAIIWVCLHVRAVRDETGRIQHYEGALEDITQRKRAEEALRQTEKLAAMGQLLAGVAHELNNPLSVVLGRAALLSKQLGAGPLAAQAEKVAAAANRCARIVKNFLALARQQPPERHAVALDQVVREAVELLAYPLRVDSVEVTLDLARDLPTLWADPHELHQVVFNLVTNAHHAMRETGLPRQLAITAHADPARTRVYLEVSDTGPGIPPEIQAHLFEPFFTTKPPGQGIGLGLSLCRGMVEGHGGSIGAESPPGGGATFRVELPVGALPAGEPPAEAAPAPEPVRGKMILVVDDEQEVAELLAEMLAADGHRVETAANGVIALAKLRGRTYDAVLCDLRMPELDGPGLYRELERRHPSVLPRLVFLTGDTLGPEIAEFLARAGAPSLGKPFASEELRRAVQRVLRARE